MTADINLTIVQYYNISRVLQKIVNLWKADELSLSFVHLQKFCYWHASRIFALWPGKLQLLPKYCSIYSSNIISASYSTIPMRELKFE